MLELLAKTTFTPNSFAIVNIFFVPFTFTSKYSSGLRNDSGTAVNAA